jgi:hypothetical protein
MKKWTVYSVITEDLTNAYKMLIPAPDKKAAEKYVEGNGEIVSVKETDWDIDVDCLADTLKRNGWGQAEIDIITRTLYSVGLDRIK